MPRRKIIEDALRRHASAFGVRIIHYSIQGNHLHLIVEAEDPRALSRAMQGFNPHCKAPQRPAAAASSRTAIMRIR